MCEYLNQRLLTEHVGRYYITIPVECALCENHNTCLSEWYEEKIHNGAMKDEEAED